MGELVISCWLSVWACAQIIQVYTAAEIANIREACRIGRLALDAVGAAIKVCACTT